MNEKIVSCLPTENLSNYDRADIKFHSKRFNKSNQKYLDLCGTLLKIIQKIENESEQVKTSKIFENQHKNMTINENLLKTYFSNNIIRSPTDLENKKNREKNQNFRTTAMIKLQERKRANGGNELMLEQIDEYIEHFLINITASKFVTNETEKLIKTTVFEIEKSGLMENNNFDFRFHQKNNFPASFKMLKKGKDDWKTVSNINNSRAMQYKTNNSRIFIKNNYLINIKNCTTFVSNENYPVKCKNNFTGFHSARDFFFNAKRQDNCLRQRKVSEDPYKNIKMFRKESLDVEDNAKNIYNHFQEYITHSINVDLEEKGIDKTIKTNESFSPFSDFKDEIIPFKERKYTKVYKRNCRKVLRILNAAIQAAKLTNTRKCIKINFPLSIIEMSISVKELEDRKNYEPRLIRSDQDEKIKVVSIKPHKNLNTKSMLNHEFNIKRQRIVKQLISTPSSFCNYLYDSKYNKDKRVKHIEKFCHCLITIKNGHPYEGSNVTGRECIPINIVYDIEKGNDIGCLNMIKTLLNLCNNQIRIIREFRLTIEGDFEEIFYK